MRPPPPLTALPRYPVVGGLALLAVGVTFAGKNGVDVSALVESPLLSRGEVWRLVTSILPHVDVFHLLFNVYWLWAFGTMIEEAFGPLRTLGIVILLAVGSGAAEYTFLDGGVGLSGVGYGLFALLWVLGRRDPRFAGAVDSQTAGPFVAWFFFCILLTATGVMAVGNIAHGAGAALGALLGVAVAGPRWRRAAAGGLALSVAAACAVATAARPWLNLSSHRGEAESRLGFDALVADREDDAIDWYRRAVSMNARDPASWYNLGIAYQRQGKNPEAVAAYRHAVDLAPANVDYRGALVGLGGG